MVLPFTSITGTYEMNFQNMPELTTPYGCFVALGVLVGLGALMIYYLHRGRMI